MANREKLRQSLRRQKIKIKRFLKSEFSRFKRIVPRFVPGNHASLLTDKEAFDAMLAAMRSAKRSINIEMYIFKDDETGQKIAKILKHKTKEGVKVNILYDAWGSITTSSRYFNDLRKSGANIAEHNNLNPIRLLRSLFFHLNILDHRKLIVVDGKTAFIGGMNLAKEYYSSWRDVMVKIQGPVVSDLQLTFFKQWQKFALKPLADRRVHSLQDVDYIDAANKKLYFPNIEPVGRQVIAVVAGNPLKSRKAVFEMYADTVGSAKKEIVIETPYFVPRRNLMKRFQRKIRHGVQFTLIVPDYKHSDVPWHNLVFRRYLRGLLMDGAKIYRYAYKHTIFHAKLCVVDRSVTIVGSSNLNTRSLKHDYEINAVIFDKDFAEKAYKNILKDRSHSYLVTKETLDNMSLISRILSNILWLFRGWM